MSVWRNGARSRQLVERQRQRARECGRQGRRSVARKHALDGIHGRSRARDPDQPPAGRAQTCATHFQKARFPGGRFGERPARATDQISIRSEQRLANANLCFPQPTLARLHRTQVAQRERMIRIAISKAAFDALAVTLPLGSVAYKSAFDEGDLRYIWLEQRRLDRLAAEGG